HCRGGTALLVLPDRPGPALGDERGGGAARATPAAAALGPGVPPVHPPLRGHRRAAPTAPDHPREADPPRRSDLPLAVRGGAELEPRGRAPRVSASAVAGSASAARRDATPALRGGHPRVPGTPRGLAAPRRGRGARIPARRGLRAAGQGGPGERELPRGPALPRLLEPGGARLVVDGRPGTGA